MRRSCGRRLVGFVSRTWSDKWGEGEVLVYGFLLGVISHMCYEIDIAGWWFLFLAEGSFRVRLVNVLA